MHSALTLSSLALALSAVRATPLPSSQSTSLTLADTVNFIAKTVGTNPNPGALPDVNNYVAVAVHSGATTNLYTLVDPSTLTLNNSDPSIFRNGSALGPDDVGYPMYLTIGNVETFSNWPFSMFFSMTHQNSSSNPGAQAGFVDLNVGVGTPGYDVVDGILAVTYAEDFFWACPDVVVEGGTAIAIGHTNRYANALPGCWLINLYAQCAGNITDANRAEFPQFQQATCYEDVSAITGRAY